MKMLCWRSHFLCRCFPYAANSPWKRPFLWSTTNTGQSLYFAGMQITIMFYLLTWMGKSSVCFYLQLTKTEKYVYYFLLYLRLRQPLSRDMQYSVFFVNVSGVCTCIDVNFGLYFSSWSVFLFQEGIHNRSYREGNGQSLLFVENVSSSIEAVKKSW